MSVKKNTLWSIAGGATPAVAAVISIPILIQYLGYERFVITSLLLSLTIFFYIYDFGVGRALTYFLPQNKNHDSTNHLLFSGLYLASILGVLISVIAYLLAPIFVSKWMRISSNLVEISSDAFQMLALGIFPSILANVVRGALEGLTEFKKANAGKILSGASIFMAPALAVLAGVRDVESISIVIVLTRFIALLFFGFLLLKTVQLRLVSPGLSEIAKIIEYSKWAALSGFISTMFVYGDRFVVSRYLDSESLAVYIFSQDILIRFLLIPWAMSAVLMPHFVAEHSSKVEFIKFYETQHKKIRNFSLFVAILIGFGLYVFLKMPTGIALPRFVFEVVLIQVVGVFFCSLSQLPLIYLYAKGKPKAISFMFLFEAMLYILVAPIIFKSYGLTGACLIWTGRLILEYALLNFYTKSTMKYAVK